VHQRRRDVHDDAVRQLLAIANGEQASVTRSDLRLALIVVSSDPLSPAAEDALCRLRQHPGIINMFGSGSSSVDGERLTDSLMWSIRDGWRFKSCKCGRLFALDLRRRGRPAKYCECCTTDRDSAQAMKDSRKEQKRRLAQRSVTK
jgi:hypothetical protein